jgi:hypothetical protein
MATSLKKAEKEAEKFEKGAYGWIITKDYFPSAEAKEGTNCNAKGVIGPGGIDPRIEQMLKEGKGRAFRMYFDDGELAYDGHIIVAEDIADMSTDEMSEQYFAPLDDFGRGNAGCTYIKYKMRKDNYAWKVL